MKTNEKTIELLAYILQRQHASVTSLMKLVYLIDLVNIKKTTKPVSNFSYVRYNFGPFDSAIYRYLEQLSNSGIITQESEFTQSGSEYVQYLLSEEAEVLTKNLSQPEIDSIESVLDQLKGYGAKALTEVAYKTKPMLKLNATLGGDENLGKPLNLNA
ncbi:MAG: Panacea domain-containing protein [Candidatus Saccharimonadales bacterium]